MTSSIVIVIAALVGIIVGWVPPLIAVAVVAGKLLNRMTNMEKKMERLVNGNGEGIPECCIRQDARIAAVEKEQGSWKEKLATVLHRREQKSQTNEGG